MHYIRRFWLWLRIALVVGLILFITYGIFTMNRQMDEHGFWHVYGEPYYGN